MQRIRKNPKDSSDSTIFEHCLIAALIALSAFSAMQILTSKLSTAYHSIADGR